MTGLANRTLFLDELDRALHQAERGADPIAVLLLDVDDFKSINDALGHAFGDQLLDALARRLASVTRAGDTVARLGGDEFALLLAPGAMPRTAEGRCKADHRQLASPFHVAETEVTVSASMGIAVGRPSRRCLRGPATRRGSGDVPREAERQGRFEIARPRMQDEALRHLAIVTDLRHALERGELEVFYQADRQRPRRDRRGRRSVDPLERSSPRARGPDRVHREAESTGLIVPIGDWVLNEACRQTQRGAEREPSMTTST